VVWIIALIMEALSTSVTSVSFYQTSRRNNPEDSHLLSKFSIRNVAVFSAFNWNKFHRNTNIYDVYLTSISQHCLTLCQIVILCNYGNIGVKYELLPSFATERLAHLPRSREVPDSNLGPKMGCPDWRFFVLFLSISNKVPW
jgi:hypothetical protein